MENRISRRTFAKGVAMSAALVALNRIPAMGASENKLHLSTNGYPWQVFYQREGRNYGTETDAMLGEVVAAGLDGFEGSVGKPEDLDSFLPLLKKHGLEMRSLYVNSTLHEPEQIQSSIANIMQIAEKVYPIGTRIIVTNPNPIRWGGPENKNDDQLRLQAGAMNRLGQALKTKGITLAYHFHDIELRMAARELHHMMVGTNPDFVTMCLDAHWVYRGAGNSEVAVFDIASLYAERISEVHIRQSRDDIWTEVLGPGDIDYPRLVKLLEDRKIKPLLVLEQAVEGKSPKTMDAEEAHRQSVRYARKVFAPLA